MKIVCLLLCFGLGIHNVSRAQCIPSSLQSLSYDTLIPGSGNDPHSFTFKKFNPALGTLVAAKVTSVVSVNYGFVLKNVESVTRNFSVSVGRYDYFDSPEMTNAYNNQFETNIGNYSLTPGSMVSQGLQTVIYRYTNLDSVVSDMANLMGAGSVNFSYKPITYTNLLGSANYYYSANANDTIHFTISYLYCNATVLPAKLTGFTASRENNEQVKLSWTAVNEQHGNKYQVQVSSDGTHFSSFGELAAAPDGNGAGSYTYHYPLQPADHDKLYFRLILTDATGAESFSEIREVSLNNQAGIDVIVYPNPASEFVNVQFNQAAAGNWQIELYASNGSRVLSNQYKNCRSARINFIRKLSAGIYCIRATDQTTQQAYTAKFVVR